MQKYIVIPLIKIIFYAMMKLITYLFKVQFFYLLNTHTHVGVGYITYILDLNIVEPILVGSKRAIGVLLVCYWYPIGV